MGWRTGVGVRSRQFVLLGLLVLHGGAIAGCQSWTASLGQPAIGVAITPIASLQHPTHQNSSLHLQGTVGTLVPLLQGTVYELQDTSGKVWVRTQQPPPKSGETVTIQGIVRYQPITINGQEQGSIYVEQQ